MSASRKSTVSNRHELSIGSIEKSPIPWSDEDGAESKEANAADGSGEGTEDVHLHGWQLATLMLLLMLGQFIMGLDATVITTAIPHITTDFHSLSDVGWYGSIFLLMVTATQPTWGKIFTYFNIKWTFIVSVVIFEAGSIICAIAPSSWVLILGRALAGVGRSALHAGGTLVVAYQVPLEKRALYFAILQSMDGIASVCGPPLGGAFTDSSLTWRFCFWINVPIGVVLIIAGLLFFKEPKRAPALLPLRQKLLSLDIPGATILTVSLLCLFMGFQNGGTKYAWSDSQTWGWLIGFGAGITIYAILQNRLGEMASIPPRIVADRTVALDCLYTALIQVGFGVHTYFLPFYFQSAKNVDAAQSGLYIVPYLAGFMAVALSVGGLLMASGALTRWMLFGGVMLTIGSGLLTTLQPNSSTGLWAGFEILAGIGIGSSIQLSLVAIQSVLAVEDLGIGNGIWLLGEFAGGAVGVAVAETIFLNILSRELAENLPELNAPAIVSAGATAISSVVPHEYVPAVQQAYDVAITRAFFLPVVAAGLATLCVLGMRSINIKK